jgi:hypothetical protein
VRVKYYTIYITPFALRELGDGQCSGTGKSQNYKHRSGVDPRPPGEAHLAETETVKPLGHSAKNRLNARLRYDLLSDRSVGCAAVWSVKLAGTLTLASVKLAYDIR